MRTPFVAAVLIAIACTSTARAAHPSYRYELVVERPGQLEDVLRQRLAYGYACAAVARSVGTKLPVNAAVVVGLEAGADVPLKRDVRVITVTPDDVDRLARRLDFAASQGFGLCGLTMTATRGGGPDGDYAVVAVLTRTGDTPTGVTYRAVHDSGRRGEWAQVQQAAAAGFTVTAVVSRPQLNVSSTSDMFAVAEKTAASRPLMYNEVVGGNSGGLKKDLDKSTARGYCVLTTWTTIDWMAVLLVKPLDAPCEDKHDYHLEESSAFMGFSVSSGDGVLLGVHRVKDAVMGLYDRTDGSFEYTAEQGVLIDTDFTPSAPRAHRDLLDKLNADGGRGYQPVDVAWRDAGTAGSRAVDVVLGRARN